MKRGKNYDRKKPAVPFAPMWTGEEPCRAVPAAFHPDQSDGRTAEIAKWICRRCPSQVKCLEWAIKDPTLEGIHGGTTARQRQRMRSSR